MDDDRALIAHVLRRTTFGPFPGQVEERAGAGVPATIDAVLSAPPLDLGQPPPFSENDDGPPKRWLKLMTDRTAGIHEKLTWFWHSHLTSSYDKVGSWKLMYHQHQLLRDHALGNFRELLQAVTIDPAMLVYLDGDGSKADAPNENYGREVMELFSLGRGNYSQDDVRAAARAFAGWNVDYDHATAALDSDTANKAPVAFLGTSVSNASDVINTLCDHPACAPFIAGRLHRFLAGADPGPDRRAELAAVFTASGLEIRPLVEAIVRHPSFLDLRLNRPRYPVEWVTAAVAALRPDDKDAAYNACSSLGQVPYYPPNVAGWPPGSRWLSASYAVARAALAVQAKPVAEVRDAADPAAAALARCSLYEPPPGMTETLRDAAAGLAKNSNLEPGGRAATLLAATVASPAFAIA
jgi:uncharacterized protein (DUF1800 family)